MEQINYKNLSNALEKALKEEHLWTKDAGKLLNINPIYVSMMLNPNSFQKAGSSAWRRLEDWVKTGDQLSSYKFPEGEEVWQPKEKVTGHTAPIIQAGEEIKKPAKEKKVEKKLGVPKMQNPPPPPEKKETGPELPAGTSTKVIMVPYDTIDKLPETEIKPKFPKAEIMQTNELTPLPQEATRVKIALDIEINLIVNGNRVQIN